MMPRLGEFEFGIDPDKPGRLRFWRPGQEADQHHYLDAGSKFAGPIVRLYNGIDEESPYLRVVRVCGPVYRLRGSSIFNFQLTVEV